MTAGPGEQLLYTAAAPFEAARYVSKLPAGHRSRRLHGHSFLAKIRVALPPGGAAFRDAEVDYERRGCGVILSSPGAHIALPI